EEFRSRVRESRATRHVPPPSLRSGERKRRSALLVEDGRSVGVVCWAITVMNASEIPANRNPASSHHPGRNGASQQTCDLGARRGAHGSVPRRYLDDLVV